MAFNPFTTLAKKGRHGDTRLAHINPREDVILRTLGGSGSINPKTGLPEYWGGGGGRDSGANSPSGDKGAGVGNSGGKSGNGGAGGGNAQGPNKDGSTVDVNPKGVGNFNTDKSIGRHISDLFGGPGAYATNPNRPNYDTSTMGVPIDMPWGDVLRAPINNPMDAFLGAAGMLASPIGYGLAGTRLIQAATGMSGGPPIGGRDDGKGAYGGQGGTGNGGMGGNGNVAFAELPKGTPTQVKDQVTAPPEPNGSQIDEMKKRIYALGLNGIPSPFGYSYGTAKWL